MRLPSRAGGWGLALIILGMLAGCSENGAADDEVNPVEAHEIPRIVPASEALSGAHLPSLDPATMNDAEIRKALGEGPHCQFRYTSSGKPVLAVKALADGTAEGVVKLNGHLVLLNSAATNDELVLTAGDVRMVLAPEGGGTQREADSIFQVGNSLRVGYRGYYRCID